MSSESNSAVPASARKPLHGPVSRAWRTLSLRLALWYVLVTLVSFLVVATVFAIRAGVSLEREGARSAAGRLERYRQALESGGTDALQAMFDCASGPRVALRLTDERDVELFGISSDEASRRAALAPNERVARLTPSEWHVATTEVSRRRKLSIAVHDEQANSLWREFRVTALLIFGLGLALAVVGATLITRRALRPVTDLARATENIVASGDLALRVETRSTTDELAQLTLLFNRMLAKNEALVKAMRESLDYVAHDLRTPLTRLRAGAELALQGPPDATKQQDALAEVIEECERTLSMLTTLTDVVEAEAGAMRLDEHREDLAQLAREAVELYEFVAKDAGVNLVTHLATAPVVVDRRRMSQVCANLLDNAIKYTPSPGHVEVTVLEEGAVVILRVRDTGVGIASDDIERVWQRLYRADPSRGERGLGLGLSLVKAVVEAHQGSVHLDSTLGHGATFEVRLPRAPIESAS